LAAQRPFFGRADFLIAARERAFLASVFNSTRL
jgi:hypothetical protein